MAEPCTAFAAATATLAATVGDDVPARAALASLRAIGLAALPSTSHWTATMVAVCEAAHALDDAAAAGEAYDLLLPFADLPVMASLAVACFGSAHRPLGLAALTLGRVDVAAAHLEAAVAADLRSGTHPCHAISRATLADALERPRRARRCPTAADLPRRRRRRRPPARHGRPGATSGRATR